MAILKQRESEIEKDCAKSLEEIVQRFEKKDIDVRHQCDDMIVAEDQTASGKVAAHVAETEKLLREPDFKDSLTAMKLQADALQKTYSALQEEQAKSTYQLTQPSAEGRLQQISLLVDSCAEKLQSVERRINEAQLKRDALVRERADGLQKIRDESAIRKAKINDQREVQSASFGKQRDDLIKSLLQSKSDRLNGVFGSMISLQRDIDSNEAEASTDRPTQVRVLVAPIGPSQPAALGLGKYMIVALFGGLVAGFLSAFILELMTSANWINSNTYIERAN
jgi:exonuclease VII small subunit